MGEPCLCGATDCRQCYPQDFYRGKYMYRTCTECECEYRLVDLKDESTVCCECREKEGEG